MATPNWPQRYLDEIHSGKVVANKKITAVYERECAWIKQPPADPSFVWHFDPALGQHHIDFMQRFCRNSKGKSGGKPIKFELFQLAKLQLIFGWVDAGGQRRFREVVDIRGRKNGKSTETAAVAHDMLIDDHENGPEIYCVANSRDQAKDGVFSESCNMRAQSPALRSLEKKRQSDIYCPMNFGIIKPLAAKTDNLDGLNASFVSQDEWHEQRDSALYDVMKQSQSFREQPLYWMISTNGFRREAFFDQKYASASGIALWQDGFKDYRTLPLVYELDTREEWTDETKWEKANPGLGRIKSMQTLREHVEQAKREPNFLPTVLTKDFNIPENSAERWLTYDDAVNETVVPLETLEHSYAIGGCDLSATTDLTCATLLIMRPGDDQYYVLQQYFVPQSKIDALGTAGNSDREAPYKRWAEQGWLTICPGSTVDYHAVTLWFADMVKTHDIRPLWICYDAALSGYWAPEMIEYGFDMDKIRQGPFTWTYPMKLLGGALHDHKIIYQNNPMLRWCLLNTAKKSSNAGGIESIQPVKAMAHLRIDGMVSLLNAWTGLQNHSEEFLPYLR